jgi:hypothetical protein
MGTLMCYLAELLVAAVVVIPWGNDGNDQGPEQPPTTRPTASNEQIEKLIAELGSESYTQRKAAARALDRMALIGLPALRKAASTASDPEVRNRANLLARTIENRHEVELHFRWFDGLGFPELSKCQLVRVATGVAWQEQGKPPHNSYHRAFLLSDEGQRFTIFTASLDRQTFEKTGPGKPEHQKVGYELLDFEKEVATFLDHYESEAGQHRLWREEWRTPRELFLLAWVSASRGHSSLVNRLLDRARQEAALATESRRAPNKDFYQAVADNIAESKMWKTVVAFGHPDTSRKELLAQFAWLAKNFPKSPHAQRVRETVALLEKMVAEDEAWAGKPARARAQWTQQEVVADLIFQLRDQNGHQWSQPGSCNIFAEDFAWRRSSKKSPARQLVEIGALAVPQLIAALGDQRFTRSVGFHRNFYFSHFVLRVGDCAEAILERIAGRRFWEPRSTSAAMLKDGQLEEVRKKVQAWWDEFQQKGERRMLVEGTAIGNWNSHEQAQRLIEKYPESALAAIRDGVRQTSDEYVYANLVQAAGELKGEEALAFMRKQLQAPYFTARVTAARKLLDRGHDEGMKMMIEEWGVARPTGTPACLIEFLLWSGRVDTVQVVGNNLNKRPARLVGEVIAATSWDWDDHQKSAPAVVHEAINALLVTELDDTRPDRGLVASVNGMEIKNPRLCDLAGEALAGRWNKPELFDLGGNLEARDRQRVALANLWRAKHGMTPLRPPQ